MNQSKEERIRFANIEIIEKGNFTVVDQVFVSNYVVHTRGKDFTGTEFVKSFIAQLRKAVENLRVVDIEFLSENSDTIVWQRTLGGTHVETMAGIPPSGKSVEWRDMMVSRFVGSRIAEEWALSDLAGQMMINLPRLKP
mgnify:CR=1 FL=1